MVGLVADCEKAWLVPKTLAINNRGRQFDRKNIIPGILSLGYRNDWENPQGGI